MKQGKIQEHRALPCIQYDKGRVKIYQVPGSGPSTGGRRIFFRKNLGGGGEDFFNYKEFENLRFHFSKKAIFEDQKAMLSQVTRVCSLTYDTYKNKLIRFHEFA